MTNREKYHRLWGQVTGLKFATEDPKLSEPERKAALSELNRLCDEMRSLEPDVVDSIDQEHGRARIDQDWLDARAGEQRAWGHEIDQMAKAMRQKAGMR